MRAWFTIASFVWLVGCVLAPVDLVGRTCPCAQGWRCVEGVCERGAGAPPDGGRPWDGGLDAQVPRDAGSPDAERLDAGLPDAGPEDAGTSDAGPGDAGPTDAGPDLTRCDDVYASALFCDGFEWTYPDGLAASWGSEHLREGGSIATVTTPEPFLGERVLTARTSRMVSGGRAAVRHTMPPERAIRDGDIWLRGWFFLPSELSISGLSLLYVGPAEGSGIAFQTHDGGDATAWIGTSGGTLRTSRAPIPRDRWTCLQLHVVVAEVGGEVEIYVDDMRFGRFTDFDTLPIADEGFRRVEAGIEHAVGSQVPATLYTDEVVLSRTRVPCD